MEAAFLKNEAELLLFLSAFENGTLPKVYWTHAAHVAVATVYLRANRKDVLSKMRNAIRHYNECCGTPNTETSGYHETLTIFWLAVVAKSLKNVEHTSALDAVRYTVSLFGEQRKLHLEYYASDIAKSVEARRAWIEPDLKILPCVMELLPE